MNPSFLAVLLVFAVVVIAFAAMIVSFRRTDARQFQDKVKKSWGSADPRLFLEQEIRSRRAYSDSLPPSIDDITAGDVDLDRVYGRIAGGTMSSPGEEVLYSCLRHPVTDPSDPAFCRALELQEYYTAHEEERLGLQKILYEVGRLKGGSFFGYIAELKNAEPIGKAPYLALGAATLACFIALFFVPLPAVIALVPILFLDFRVHMRMKDRTLSAIRGFQSILRLADGADGLLRVLPEAAFSEERRELQALLKVFGPVRRGSFLVTSGGSVGTGLADAVLEYVKMFFHLDLIRFDGMLKGVREHEAEAVRLLELIGGLDAACAAASFRKSLAQSCRPEFEAYIGAERVKLSITEMAHPLLENPVRNSFETDSPILLTGSNASGKSTFLKSVALSAILAQSIGTVPASSYRAPCFRIYSSMALKDNLLGGESYFVVELKSLKRICDAAKEEGTPVLAFVDEVLRGTNTIERIAASSNILKSLAVPTVMIFAATHDIELSYLLADTYRNLHFQETALEGDLHFDYLLKEGRAEAGNALRLMEALGYDGSVIAEADDMAKRFLETGEWSS